MLKQLREQLAALEKRAADKQAELADGLEPQAIRAIEDEHKAILAEIDDVRGKIAEAEAVEAADVAARAANQVDVDAAVARGIAAERSRIDDINRIGRQARMGDEAIAAAVRGNVDVQTFTRQAFDHLAQRSSSLPTEPARILRDEDETRRSGMVSALAFRMGGTQPQGDDVGPARPFMDYRSLAGFAASAIGHRGGLETVRDREDVIARAFHSTSDFPEIFSSAINTVLESRYAAAPNTYRRISAQMTFMDFRPHHAVSIGDFPMLEKLTEGGDIKFGTFGEGKETIAVVPYAKGIKVSRQMLVNDRLGAIGELLGGYGRTVALFEEVAFYAMMLSANTKLSDNKVVFHADHDNLAGAGTAITVAAVGAGRAAMRKQKSLDGNPINIGPSILLVGPDKETEAQQFLAPLVVNAQANVNPIAASLSSVVSGQLTGNAWYLFANPADAPVYKWGFLDGYEAPRIRLDEPFGTQGLAMTVEHDFGVGATDFRGGYKNPGA